MSFLLYQKIPNSFYSKYLMIQDKDIYTQLMIEAQSGSSESYHILLSRVSVTLSKFLSRRIFSVDDREDLLQEILIAIHNSRHTYLPSKPFHPWMYAIAKNLLFKYYKKINKQYSQLVDIEMNQLVSPNESSSDGREKVEKILLLIQGLPRKQKEIVSMLKIQGLSVKEVSLKLRISESNVRVIAHRGYQTIRLRITNEN